MATLESTESRCPACGGRAVPIAYGMPDGAIFEASERNEVELGCHIGDSDPDTRCAACGHRWRTDQPC